MKHLYPAFAILLMCILSHTIAIGQTGTSNESYPEGIVITMPELERHLFQKKDNIILTNIHSYHERFKDFESNVLPAIDFEKNYLLGVYVCHYCFNCPPDYQKCHRSACSYSLRWFLIEWE